MDYQHEKEAALKAEAQMQTANAAMPQGYIGGGYALDEPCKAPLT